jgi:hypothetical protein
MRCGAPAAGLVRRAVVSAAIVLAPSLQSLSYARHSLWWAGSSKSSGQLFFTTVKALPRKLAEPVAFIRFLYCCDAAGALEFICLTREILILEKRRLPMMDAVMVLFGLLMFLAFFGYTSLCENL